MSDLKLVSPLLDGYTVEKTVITQADRSWYSVRHTASGECFILKHLSIPASDAQVRALILSGILACTMSTSDSQLLAASSRPSALA